VPERTGHGCGRAQDQGHQPDRSDDEGQQISGHSENCGRDPPRIPVRDSIASGPAALQLSGQGHDLLRRDGGPPGWADPAASTKEKGRVWCTGLRSTRGGYFDDKALGGDVDPQRPAKII